MEIESEESIMDNTEKEIRCTHGKFYVNEDGDVMCVVYGRNVKNCSDCAFISRE